jgi:hypothetical protein
MNLPSGGLGSPSMHAQSHTHPHPLATGTGVTTGASRNATNEKLPEPLKGLTVHIIHVKDTLMDGPSLGVMILEQLRALERECGLGVEFDVCTWGESIWV